MKTSRSKLWRIFVSVEPRLRRGNRLREVPQAIFGSPRAALINNDSSLSINLPVS
jgi:hypothetical protein